MQVAKKEELESDLARISTQSNRSTAERMQKIGGMGMPLLPPGMKITKPSEAKKEEAAMLQKMKEEEEKKKL